jgi:hypothetical protein
MTTRLRQALRNWADGHGFISVLLNARRIAEGYQPIFLDYPVKALPRYGYGKPPHPELAQILSARDETYRALLQEFLRFRSHLLSIPKRAPVNSPDPSWIHEWLGGLDTVALYGFAANRSPSLIVEVGSGYSTKLMRRAINDHQLSTKLVSIDPHPRAEIDSLCNDVIRQPLEECDLRIFDQLQSGDILFMDGSHRCLMNSDVTVFFLEILPRIKAGVLVHIHDIFLPEDYVPYWMQRYYPHRYWSEQYVLAASLLAGHKGYEVVLPNHYVSITPALSGVLDPFWNTPSMQDVSRTGTSFWIETR